MASVQINDAGSDDSDYEEPPEIDCEQLHIDQADGKLDNVESSKGLLIPLFTA